MSIYTPKQQKNLILAFTLILGAFLIYSMIEFVSALLGAIIMYTLLRSYFMKLVDVKKWKKSSAALMIMLISFIILILPFFTLSWMIVDKINYYTVHVDEVRSLVSHLSASVGVDLNDSNMMSDVIQKAESWALGTFPSILSSIFNIFFLIAIMYFILYFMFTEHVAFENALLRYMPFKPENAMRLAGELQKITQTNVIGQGVIALVQGMCLTLGFYIFNIPDAIFWGVLATLLSFVPLLGAAIVFIPAGLIELSFNNYYSGVGILVYGIVVVSNIDNVLRLIINKKIANMHPLISILGVIIGIPLFGILGLVFGPLLISFFILSVGIYEAKIGIRDAEDVLPTVFDTESDKADLNEHS